MKVRPGFIFFISLFIPCVSAICQQATISLPFTRYTVANGLAQMQVRSIYADKDGLVWIGTQGGISVYDGNDMRPLNDQGPLSEKYIVNLIRGSDQLFISTHTDQYMFDGHQISLPGQQPPFHETFVQFEDINKIVWYHADGKGWFLRDGSGDYHSPENVYPALRDIHIKAAWGSPESNVTYLVDDVNRFYTFHNNNSGLHIDSLTFSYTDNIAFTGNNTSDLSNILLKKSTSEQQLTDIYKISDNRIEHVATANADGQLQAISSNAPSGYIHNHQGVNHVFILMDSVYVPEAVPAFNGIRFAVESFHKLFVATDEGFVVIHLDGIENINYPACGYAWSVVPGRDDQLFLGCYKSGVHHLGPQGNLIKHYQLPAFRKPAGVGDQILTNYTVTPEYLLWGSNGGFIALGHQDDKLLHIPVHSSIEAFAYDSLYRHVIAGGKRLDFFNHDLSQHLDSIEIPAELLGGAFVNDMLVTPDHSLWIAASGGIMKINLEDHAVESLWTKEQLPCSGAVTVEIDEEGTIWSGGTCGLMSLQKGDSVFRQLLPEIIRQRVNQLLLIPGKRLVCASNNNVYVLDISKQNPVIINMYNHHNGLNLFEPSENGISITRNQYVWLPSVEGIQRLNLDRIPEKQLPVRIIVIRMNDIPVRSFNITTDTLVTNGSAALVELSRIDHSGKTWKFQFSLNGEPFTPWQDSKEFLISGLRHGNNNVRFRASWNIADPESSVGSTVIIKSRLPFLERVLVQRVLIFLTGILMLLIILTLIRNQRILQREQSLRADLYRNRLKTIQAYLNPHFLFNTLTSIQDRILQHDAKAGNDLIIRLARVFRKVLDTGKSEEQKIPLIHLSEEMDLVNDMVYLNNAQMNTPVNMIIDIDPIVRELDPVMPPLLIQPFVENAFKHAFADSEKNKTIHIKASKEGNTLIVQIKDNGKGYAASQNLSENSSMGSFLANERMKILNELNVENSITIHNEAPRGTLVEIKIQLQK